MSSITLMRKPLAIGAVAATLGGFMAVAWYLKRKHHTTSADGDSSFRARYERELNTNGGSADMNHGNRDNGMDTSGVWVLYGSESGNAESLAKDLAFTLRERGVDATLVDPSQWAYMENYLYHNRRKSPLFSSLKTGKAVPQILLCVIATTGEGEAPGNIANLYQEIQATVSKSNSKSAAGPFSHVKYAVFGLGDSSYKYYCKAGITINSALKKGGGLELERVGFGDARSSNQEDNFEDWKERLLSSLVSKAGITLAPVSLSPPEPQLQYVTYPEKEEEGGQLAAAAAVDAVPYPPPPPILEPTQHLPLQLLLTRKEVLAEPRASDGSCILRCTFDISGTQISYQAGDHIGIYPTNPPHIVARLCTMLGVSDEALQTRMELQHETKVLSRSFFRNVFPSRVSLGVALSYYVDLCAKPKRSTLRILARYCTDEAERDAFLLAIAPPRNDEDDDDEEDEAAADKTNTNSTSKDEAVSRRTVLDYMEMYPSCQAISLPHLLEILPRIRPRYYSIASDRLSHPHEIIIYVRAQPQGLASDFLLQRVSEGDRVFAFVRTSTFHLPSRKASAPLLLIGPGTGVAAMVGLCHRREALMRTTPSARYGACRMYFGAQHEATEYFVREELTRWAMPPSEMAAWDGEHPDSAAGASSRVKGSSSSKAVIPRSVISDLRCAFSRDQADGKKLYVTHLIDQDKDEIFEMLMNKECMVFASGDASAMAKDLDRTLISILQEKGKMPRLSALEHIRAMEGEKRFLKDVY